MGVLHLKWSGSWWLGGVGGWLASKVIRLMLKGVYRWVACILSGQVCDGGGVVGGWLAFKVIRLVVAVGCRWVACIQSGQVCDGGVCVDGCLAS